MCISEALNSIELVNFNQEVGKGGDGGICNSVNNKNKVKKRKEKKAAYYESRKNLLIW